MALISGSIRRSESAQRRKIICGLYKESAIEINNWIIDKDWGQASRSNGKLTMENGESGYFEDGKEMPA